VCKHLDLSDLDDQGIRAFFQTFRMSLLLSRNWYPGDTCQYAIRGHRHFPKTPYPKNARNATFYTLGTSASDFDSWEMEKATGDIGELEITGPKGLCAALATVWGDGDTLAKISITTDFGSDLLDPPG
jgi:hypothetical protein